MRYVWDDDLETWVPAINSKRGLDRVIVAGVGGKAGWPILSDALGVLPRQIPEAREELAKQGVQANFTEGGRLELRDVSHRRQVLKALSKAHGADYYDKDAFC